MLALVASFFAGCSLGDDSQAFEANGLSLRYPIGWHSTGFSTTNSPRRLIVASYVVPDDAVEGDCGGYCAVELLPADGALVLVIDYGSALAGLRPSERFPPRPRNLTLRDGERETYECFGESTMFRFRIGDRNLQVHVALGPEASDRIRDQALGIVASLSVDA